MPSLSKAFKEMRRKGLIAKRECYCEHCGKEKMLEEVQSWREKKKDIRGFGHLGECEGAASLEEARIPLLFGPVKGSSILYHDPDCQRVGEIVAECLREEGIRYEWDGVSDSPILILPGKSLTWLPVPHKHQPLYQDEEHRLLRAHGLPDSAFDTIADNPVRLLNVSRAKRLRIDDPRLHGTVKRPRVGDRIKLGFLVSGAVAPLARKELGEMADRLQLESMWVEVTSAKGKYPHCTFRGELTNAPYFIDPGKLRIGSPVDFTPGHVYPAEQGEEAGTEASIS
jgi:hypothetical protein